MQRQIYDQNYTGYACNMPKARLLLKEDKNNMYIQYGMSHSGVIEN